VHSALRVIVCAMLVLAVFALPGMADVKLPAVVGSHMVLQQGMQCPIWGWADAGEAVTVSMCGKTATAKADAAGKWSCKLGPFAVGGPFDMIVAGKNTLTLTDIMVGEVWVCSGQSNMQMNVRGVVNAEQEIAEANYPNLRLFSVPLKAAVTPQTDVNGQWAACTPANVPGFSAAAYFFGRHLLKALNVPIGLIHTSWGGTPAEAWTQVEKLKADPEYNDLFTRWDKMIADYPAAMEKYNNETLPKWREAAAQAKADGKPEPRRPNPPNGELSQSRPGNLYNAMIAPLVPFAMRGAIWYQGEANAGRAYQYRKLMPTLISNWREVWGQGDFPFLIVQLANYMARRDQPGESAWAELREAQYMTTRALPNVGMACIIDIGMADNIHPTNKQDVGKRLGLSAEKIAYGRNVVFSGPTYESMTRTGNALRVKFANAYGGMVAQGGGALKGFAIAGADKKWVWANAEIDGDSVVVWAEGITDPVAVRYAWADNPECNLYNAGGLPAVPFRSDDWPGVTINSH
jgi:sialate O-acetylesterase